VRYRHEVISEFMVSRAKSITDTEHTECDNLERMVISSAQFEQYQAEGFLILEDFVGSDACESLRARAAELVHQFEPEGAISIFSTAAQNHIRDDYFLESGDKIRFFFEEDAFLPDGTLKQRKERSINKNGHALHELDPVFSEFSRAPAIQQ
jgi:phytanoyl-CoA hydroxylase